MTRDEMIKALNKWRSDIDPENRRKNYSISDSIFPNQEELTIDIFGKEILKFNFSISEFDKVIFEHNENPDYSGYVTLKSFNAKLYCL